MTQGITVQDAVHKIKNGDAVLIDVREPEEFKSEHIAYALSVPLSSLEGGFQMLDIPKDKAILFQCLKGSRGQMACERIQGLGSCENRIMNIEGGIEAWKEAGLPVIGALTSTTTPKISIMRQVQIIVGLGCAFRFNRSTGIIIWIYPCRTFRWSIVFCRLNRMVWFGYDAFKNAME